MTRAIPLLAALLLLAPAAAAQDGQVWVESLEARGDLTQTGDLHALSIGQVDGGAALHGFTLHGGRLVIHEFTREGVRASVCEPPTAAPACDGVAQQASEVDHARYPESGTYHGVRLVATSSDALMVINVLPTTGARVVAKTAASNAYSLENACLSPEGIEQTPDQPCRAYNEEEGVMSTIPLPAPVGVTNATQGAALRVVGDFVIETHGLTLRAEDTEGSWWSGYRTSGEPAGTYEHRLLRLVIEGGILEVDYGGGMHVAEWALGGSQTEAMESVMTLYGARGVLDLGDGPRELTGTETLRGDFLYASDPRAEGMGLTLGPASTAAVSDAQPPAVTAAWAWVVAGAIIIAVGAALLARRRTRMQDVEGALEAGKYARAARLAARVLRRDPRNESAMLGRAIAWERAGRPGRVIPVVQQYLEEREPNDGALHYVLGLAYLDVGDKDSAKDALAEATRRTPALLADVAPELRPRPEAAGYS